jgi:hypothetical protein
VNVITITQQDGGSLVAYYNGIQNASKGTAAQNNSGLSITKIGTAGTGVAFADVTVAEMIVYDSALGTSDREAVEAHLIAKWGVT